jgi:hypothetical protein
MDDTKPKTWRSVTKYDTVGSECGDDRKDIKDKEAHEGARYL